jgi:hypothetical protein
LQAIAHHAFVAFLEDVQRHDHVRKQQDVRKREDRQAVRRLRLIDEAELVLRSIFFTGDCSLATIFSFSPADVSQANVIPGHYSPRRRARRHGPGVPPPLSKLPSLYHSACGTSVKVVS